MGATNDDDGSLRDVEIFREELDECFVSFAVVGAFGGSNSDFVVNNTFWVGVYPGMTDEMIDYMAKTIKAALEQ